MTQKYEAYVAKKLASIYETNDFQNILGILKKADKQFSKIREDLFGMEYLASRLALACRVWEHCCEENGVQEEIYEKMLLRKIMNSFQSPKYVDLASSFSDYLYHDPGKPNPVISIADRFYQRLDLKSTVGEGKAQKVTESFQTLVALSDSFRTSFENDFFEFANAS